MAQVGLDVIALGNAIVDVIAKVDDAFLASHNLPKGGMTLVDADQATAIYDAMGPAREASGGSAANTAAGIASFGGKAGFIGRVRDDQLGESFEHDIRAIGVKFETPHAMAGLPTARCFVFVTPDAERTMMTFLGASTEIAPADISEDALGGAKILYIEGYLWDQPAAKAAVLKAAGLAHAAGAKVAFSLSDSFCVERHRDEFQSLLRDQADIVFANEAEIMALYETQSFEEAANYVAQDVGVAVLTRGASGSLAINGENRAAVLAEEADGVIDTTGAGDLYAAGFLYGWATGRDLETCARLGGIAAAEVISHLGARPETSLADLATRHGL